MPPYERLLRLSAPSRAPHSRDVRCETSAPISRTCGLDRLVRMLLAVLLSWWALPVAAQQVSNDLITSKAGLAFVQPTLSG